MMSSNKKMSGEEIHTITACPRQKQVAVLVTTFLQGKKTDITSNTF